MSWVNWICVHKGIGYICNVTFTWRFRCWGHLSWLDNPYPCTELMSIAEGPLYWLCLTGKSNLSGWVGIGCWFPYRIWKFCLINRIIFGHNLWFPWWYVGTLKTVHSLGSQIRWQFWKCRACSSWGALLMFRCLIKNASESGEEEFKKRNLVALTNCNFLNQHLWMGYQNFLFRELKRELLIAFVTPQSRSR